MYVRLQVVDIAVQFLRVIVVPLKLNCCWASRYGGATQPLTSDNIQAF